MYSLTRSDRQRSINIWPGFVDGLASLLLVVIFVLMVFMVSQVFLSTALTGRDEALQQLERQVAELGDLLALERTANAELRVNIAQISDELQTSLEEQESLSARIASITAENRELESDLASARQTAEEAQNSLAQVLADLQASRGTVSEQQAQLATRAARIEELEAQAARRQAELEEVRSAAAARREKIDEQAEELAARAQTIELQKEELEELYTKVDADRETIETQLIELQALKSLREELDAELDRMEQKLAARQLALEKSQEKSEKLESELSATQLDQQSAEKRAEALAGKLAETATALGEQQELSKEQKLKIDLLNRQLASLRRQMARLNAALEASEAEVKEQKVQIAELGKRLNTALATKVQELARYRSEFFGRLREILGDRRDVRIVGDRFVFQSEVLFDSGEADLEEDGRRQIIQLADTFKDVASRIPEDIDWVLQVEGHTDRRPIRTDRFPSNWELSTARAIQVVKLLIDAGIPPERLAASGYAHYKPLDTGNDEIAYRRNRRIELKLTNRGE